MTERGSGGSGELQAIVSVANEVSGLDFDQYRDEPIRRRIAHRMRATARDSAAAYLGLLGQDPAERMRLVDALLIKTTQPFRGASTFEALRARLLPELVARRAREGATVLRAWSAGCSSGQEALSLALCLFEAREASGARMDVSVIGTDVDPTALEQAARGRLRAPDAAEVPANLASRYLVPDGDGAKPVAAVRAALTFARHDLLGRSPAPHASVFASFDIVACRNVLIYLRPAAQESTLKRLVASCERGGLLALDESETPPPSILPMLTRVVSGASIWTPRRP